jgi:SAM-dependent methyltransferase
MTKDDQTVSTYDDRAQQYVDLISTDKPSAQLQAFMNRLPAGGHALDLGCGPGNSAAMMRDAGFEISASDASPEMAALGSKKYGVKIDVGTFDDLDEVAAFDGVWASFSLLHAPRVAMPRHLTAISRSLKPGGIFVVGLKTGNGEARDKLGRLYTYFQRDELESLLRDAGLTPIHVETGEDFGLAGDVEPWVFITAHA